MQIKRYTFDLFSARITYLEFLIGSTVFFSSYSRISGKIYELRNIERETRWGPI